jgi:tripartite-type tricarboxylate transporter receptor subunit TctC
MSRHACSSWMGIAFGAVIIIASSVVATAQAPFDGKNITLVTNVSPGGVVDVQVAQRQAPVLDHADRLPAQRVHQCFAGKILVVRPPVRI